jgi:hypothetical protein
MSRLIAFGCSHTYGHGLPDCFIPPYEPGKIPSKLAWPNHLAKLMNIDNVVNKSLCGSSCKEIWNEILKFNFEEDDVVFILWSFRDRSCVFTDEYPDPCSGIIKILPGDESKHSKIFYKMFYSDIDRDLDFSLRTDHCSRYLKSLNLKFYNLYVNHMENVILSSWNSTHFLNVCFLDFLENYPRAYDGSHAGLEANQAFAASVFKEITALNEA